MASPSDRRCKARASFPKNFQSKFLTKATGAIKGWHFMALKWSRGMTVIPRYSENLTGLSSKEGTVYKVEEGGCRGATCKCTKNGFIDFLSSVFLMPYPTIIFAFSHFFVMLLKLHYFSLVFGYSEWRLSLRWGGWKFAVFCFQDTID